MRTIEKTIYKYDELPTEAAKAKAREWYRETGLDYEWWDAVYEDAKTILAAIGFSDVDIRFSGFYCQGDGASFTGRYGLAAGWRDTLREYCPLETEVFAVAESLDAMQARHDGRLVATVERDRYGYSRYCHDGAMAASLHDEGGDDEVSDAEEAEFLELARRLARWIYRNLEAAWDGINEDESVASVIIDNDYEFWADGSRCRE
jgi:hypothetical protein